MKTRPISGFDPVGNAKAAKRFFGAQVVQFGEPKVVVPPYRDIAYAMNCRATGKLRSYTRLVQALDPDIEHRAHKGLNHEIENSDCPTPKHEQIMDQFKSPRQAQRFLSTHDQISTIIRPADTTCRLPHTGTQRQMDISNYRRIDYEMCFGWLGSNALINLA